MSLCRSSAKVIQWGWSITTVGSEFVYISYWQYGELKCQVYQFQTIYGTVWSQRPVIRRRSYTIIDIIVNWIVSPVKYIFYNWNDLSIGLCIIEPHNIILSWFSIYLVLRFTSHTFHILSWYFNHIQSSIVNSIFAAHSISELFIYAVLIVLVVKLISLLFV